ncbi:hypothetical protein A2U01_0050731, partial [Trifolium medium]|nr:hypothetical protein [Trifolium medium]
MGLAYGACDLGLCRDVGAGVGVLQ